MKQIAEFCSTKSQHTRIMNALWKELHPRKKTRDRRWSPSPQIVANLRLPHIEGIGGSSLAAVEAWLSDCGYGQPAKQKKPHRIDALAEQVATLTEEMNELRRQVASFTRPSP